MDAIQKALHKVMETVPRRILAQLLAEKLHERKMKLSRKKLDELATRLLTEKTDVITFDHGKPSSRREDITIEITDDDIRFIEQRTNDFIAKFSEFAKSVSENITLEMHAALKKQFKTEFQQQRRDLADFRKRLERRWGAGLNDMRMLVTIAREFGSEIHRDLRANGGGERPQSFEVLIRLHARACQVFEEVVCLLSNGFADGAMARWRTLHEIAAVTSLIVEGGDQLAERYDAHRIVESHKAAHQYRRYSKRLGHAPISDKEIQQIDKIYNEVLDRYGPSFGTQQGWASEHLKKERPTIADIQEAAEIGHMAPFYRWASHNVHASPNGTYFKLGLIGDSQVLLAGPSNAGLADPGHAAALSLLAVSASLLQLHATIDNNVMINVMRNLADEIGDAMLRAHRQMVAEEHTADAEDR